MKAALLFLLLCLLPSAALAQPVPGAPLPYVPWDGERSVGLPAAPAEEKPRALERAPDFSRRVVELGPDLGAALPSCAGHVDENAPCGALAPGLFLGLSALWRPGPYFAFGGGFHVADFGGKSDMTPERASGRFYEGSAVARVYMLESGRIEPYLELWLGAGSQRTAASPLGQPRFEQRSFGVSGRVGGGVDFYLGEQLRLGPSFSALRTLATSSELCASGSRCRALELDRQGQLLGAYVLALRVTLSFGSRL
jgi:hypothetical protein